MKFAEAIHLQSVYTIPDRNCDFIHSDLIILLARRKCLDWSSTGARLVPRTAAVQFMIGFAARREMEKERG